MSELLEKLSGFIFIHASLPVESAVTLHPQEAVMLHRTLKEALAGIEEQIEAALRRESGAAGGGK